MSETWDAAGYVASSRYRLAVCEYLRDYGPGLPSEIATDTDLAQPHVSRALSELRERDVVELLVPESQQKGRLYDLTESGRLALDRLTRGRDAVDIEVIDRGEFRYDGLVDYLEEHHDDIVDAVGVYDGDVARVYFFDGEPPERDTAPIVRLWTTSAPNGELISGATGRHEFTVYGLENVTLVDVAVEESVRIGISLDDTAGLGVRQFVEELESYIEN